MYIGIHTASIPQVFASAQRRIVLHAALYNKFATSPAHSEALEAALARPGFKKLQAITLPFALNKQWTQEFLQILRPGYTIGEMEHEFNSSINFLVRLAAQHEGMVEIYETQALPCMPVLIIDDCIFFGHYAHSDIMAPDGYWFSVSAPVEELMENAYNGTIPKEKSPKQRASFRFISECVYAMKHAKRMLL